MRSSVKESRNSIPLLVVISGAGLLTLAAKKYFKQLRADRDDRAQQDWLLHAVWNRPGITFGQLRQVLFIRRDPSKVTQERLRRLLADGAVTMLPPTLGGASRYVVTPTGSMRLIISKEIRLYSTAMPRQTN